MAQLSLEASETPGLASHAEPAANLDYAAAIADWCLDSGDRSEQRGDLESALEWNQLAARILSTQSRDLVNRRIEANLQRFAAALEELPVDIESASARKVWLHVFNEAFGHGGHTAMAERWVRNDRSGRTHCFVLLSQTGETPARLQDAAAATGGTVYRAPEGASLLQRAAWLRGLSRAIGSHVVLHVHSDDVMAAVAFGISGGPPVLLVNHSAHIFWTGPSTTDLVINCRGSELELHWTRAYRGVERAAIIPIPLVAGANSENGEVRRRVRAELGVGDDELMLLTVGDSFKYAPMGGLDFFAESEAILRSVPGARLIAVGPQEDERWKAASERTGGRMRTLGRQSRVSDFHHAADLYVEGFPFGSTTAVLEAGLSGLPVVLAPWQSPPPFTTDGVALDHVLERPRTTADYRDAIVRLCGQPEERIALARKLQESIQAHHSGPGWIDYLERAIASLPARHSVRPPWQSTPTPRTDYEYWARFRYRPDKYPAALLATAIELALARNLRPRLTSKLLHALAGARPMRIGRSVPMSVLRAFCNFAVPLLTRQRSERLLGALYASCRPGAPLTRVFTALVPARLW